VNLVVAAEAPPEVLFTAGEHSAEFQRTVSRLHEMRSSEYLGSERRRSGGKVQGL
jgi:cell division protein ZapE